ncbi:MAG: hypothetical protein JWP61_2789, partial [Friedmanniella sp.]|nr:hypothetical protein [Friedmanniella sp.]
GLSTQSGPGVSLLAVLGLVAGLTLLITRVYPRPMFALLMGVYRWGYRVLAYVALMRDEYPPFQLDQGAADPGEPPQPEPVTAPEPVTVAG